MNQKAICVLEFAKTESIVTVQRRFRIMYHTEPSPDETIREWYMNSSWWLPVRCEKNRPSGPIGLVEPGSRPRPLVQKKTWRDSVPIDMLLFTVSVLVVAQSSSKIPKGLMNNPVYPKRMRHKKSQIFIFVHDSTNLCSQVHSQVVHKAQSLPLVTSVVTFKLLYFVTLYVYV